jgi:hypothetical protein
MPHDSEHHAQHDPLLVVSLAADDLTGTERDLATSLINDCAECATLHADLIAIARATAVLPAATRPRDFQLSPEQAARLRPAGWRRFIAAFGSPQLAMTRQLGVGLTTLGLAGLLITVLPSVQIPSMGSAGAAPASEQSRTAANEGSSDASAATLAAPSAAPASAAASSVPDNLNAQPSASAGGGLIPMASPYPGATAASGGPGTQGYHTAQNPDPVDESTAPDDRELLAEVPTQQPGVSPLLVASVILLAAGIALLIARRIARSMSGS